MLETRGDLRLAQEASSETCSLSPRRSKRIRLIATTRFSRVSWAL
jgi:hypothetical protein